MKVLVTGSSGFLATNTIIRLIESGYSVRGLIRNKNSCLVPLKYKFELVEGDVNNLKALEKAVKGCDYIVHAAAETSQGKVKFDDYARVNIKGTENICILASEHKIKRLIYISTINVFGYGTIDEPGDETTKIKAPFSNSLYVISKQKAEEIALSFKNNFDIIVLNPCFMIGAYDQKPGPGRLVLSGYNKRMVFVPPGGKNLVHVEDVANGIVNALSLGKNGEKYILGNENLTFKEFFQKISKLSDKKQILIKIPKIILLFIGSIGNTLKLAGINNEIFMTNIEIMSVNNFYSSKKAQSNLKLEFKSIESALEDFLSWHNDRINKKRNGTA